MDCLEVIKGLDSVVQASIITVGGMLAVSIFTIILNCLFNYLNKKKNTKERFFYEIYPKRLAAYEETRRTLAELSKKDLYIREMTLQEFNDKILNINHTISDLYSLLCIYGSINSKRIIYGLFLEIGENYLKNTNGSIVSSAHISIEYVNEFRACVNLYCAEFTDCIAEEMGADFMDKQIAGFMINMGFKAKDYKPTEFNMTKP